MHVIFREQHGLDDDTPFDVGQSPADLVVLSFSDSDLGAFKAGWKRADDLPSLRLANLVALKHPLSVDTYVENTLSGAKAILIRLIGGQQYWSYGIAQVQDLARRNGIALAILPADGREDPRLDALSTLPKSTLRQLTKLCDQGGAVAAHAALAQLSIAAGLYAKPVAGKKSVPQMGLYDPNNGIIETIPTATRPLVYVSFYRSYLTSADTDPIDKIIHALRADGFDAYGVFAKSLKSDGVLHYLETLFDQNAPVAIVNATAFSAKGNTQSTSPFDHAGVPVFQVALSTARRKDWADAERGLSPADLAMHVVLPEVDGRLFAGVVSFKTPEPRDPDLQYSRFIHQGDEDQINRLVSKIRSFVTLRTAENSAKKLTIVLSTYPGKSYQMAHAVGLDALASARHVVAHLAKNGYACSKDLDLETALKTPTSTWPLEAYEAALSTLPHPLQEVLFDVWGAPSSDPSLREGNFHFHSTIAGNTTVALQPERGPRSTREDDYHDTGRVPCHAYVAFYLWLKSQQTDALIHMGAHGTLEWLPGKSVAQSGACWPEALSSGLPIFYPFIVNDPGEAAQAKRRVMATTLGHMPPPLTATDTPEKLLRLEHLLDEYSTADGLDPARRDRLIDTIREEAQASGVENDLGLSVDASAAEAITRIDAFVCDIKESQFGDGLHIYGTGACGDAELSGLLDALAGKFVAAGPSGSPFRGRLDVTPTGRNLFATDPRSVPTRAGHAQGVKIAEELIRRHLQDEGDYPNGLVVDLWGSATMRTAGEEFAMAMHLAGVKPKWDDGSDRVSGFEIEPLAVLGRPRIDVTLRVSGLFRDVFPGLASLFEQASKVLSERDEDPADNPYVQKAPRVFGPKPGQYGLEMGAHLDEYSDEARHKAGEAWLKASEWAISQTGDITQERAALETRVKAADSFVHIQDLAETDLLIAEDYASHEAGFAAAVKSLGQEAPALYHMDSTKMGAPKARSLREEIARVVQARATNPNWANGMMRHGYRGAAEIAATLDHMAAFQHLSDSVAAHLFDQYYEATLGREDVLKFLKSENPEAFQAMQDRFRALWDAGLWQTRRNSIIADLEALT
ncbi:MAG: cobaltochelatase subunit CobN [Halocynthiibacter sp.]